MTSKSQTYLLILAVRLTHDMSYLELFQYFKGLDIDTVDLLHYMYVRNLLIDKKVLNDEKLPIDFHKSYMGDWLDSQFEEVEEVF